MRPDCSVRVTASNPVSAVASEFWLHFDSKYRVEHLADLMVGNVEELETANPSLAAKRTDLLKMHAYRDAIRRSAGAYVLYPGDDGQGENLPMYSEVLPGLGAFPLRVGVDGEADLRDASNLLTFLQNVVEHAANQASQHERARHWLGRSFGERAGAIRAEGFLNRPPADTPVLLGYVRGFDHRAWVVAERLYNVRAGDRVGAVPLGSQALAAELVVLYGRDIEPDVWIVSGAPRILDRSALAALGYPNPGGDLYFCLPLGDRASVADPTELKRRVQRTVDRTHGHRRGEPVALSWSRLMGS
jgi:hypothetical protein